MPELSTEDLVKGLRAWTRNHDAHVRAAAELLIWHEYWLRRADFRKKCVTVDRDGSARIGWDAARAYCDDSLQGSTSELAILDLAVALGEDRYRLGIMGTAHARAIADAVAAAVGVTRG